MRKAAALILGLGVLAGCAGDGRLAWPWAREQTPQAAPQPRPEATAPAVQPERRGGRLTPEGFDLTSAAEREAARAAGGGALLGRTVASLGAPQEQGFWLRTGLVTSEREGRVAIPETGASVAVTLRPSGGPASAGSQLSLAAFRVLGAPLTSLPQLEVYAGG
jgi:hypothetical protein